MGNDPTSCINAIVIAAKEFTETKDCGRIDLPTASNITEPDFEADSLSYSIIGFYLLDEEDREALMNLSNIDHLRPTIEPENAQVKNVH